MKKRYILYQSCTTYNPPRRQWSTALLGVLYSKKIVQYRMQKTSSALQTNAATQVPLRF